MDLYEAIRTRRDTRHFTADPVPPAVLERALRAALAGPSVGLSQPWRFVDISQRDRHGWLKSFAQSRSKAEEQIADPERQQLHQRLKLEGLEEAPVLLALFCAYPEPETFTLGTIGNPRALEWSCACAIQNLWLALTAEGYGAGWVTILDLKAMAEELKVPQLWEPLGILCIGKPADSYGGRPMLEQEQWGQRDKHLDHFYFTEANLSTPR